MVLRGEYGLPGSSSTLREEGAESAEHDEISGAETGGVYIPATLKQGSKRYFDHLISRQSRHSSVCREQDILGNRHQASASEVFVDGDWLKHLAFG